MQYGVKRRKRGGGEEETWQEEGNLSWYLLISFATLYKWQKKKNQSQKWHVYYYKQINFSHVNISTANEVAIHILSVFVFTLSI